MSPCHTNSKPIAIIGAGLAGLTLALSLQRENIPSTIYELRAEDHAPATGAIMLSPNALRLLDTLGLYQDLRTRGWNFEALTYLESSASEGEGAVKDSFRKLGSYDLGHERKYGYKALRIYREDVLSLLKEAVVARGVKIEYGRKFDSVVREDGDGVTVRFVDGMEVEAPLLIGADGIHSSVRKHIQPGIEPKYGGIVAVTGAVQKQDIDFPSSLGDSESSFPLPASIQGPDGAFLLAPQNTAGTEMLCGTQFRFPEQERSQWKDLTDSKEKLRDMLVTSQNRASALAKSAAENVDLESMSTWAFYTVPKMENWSSGNRKVIILGDAAHAIPPTAGQGASQAFEDGFFLATLISGLPRGVSWTEAVHWWQSVRQTRIDRVLELTARLNNARLPKELKDKLPQDKLWSSDSEEDLSWLYKYDIEAEIQTWAKKAKEGCPIKAWLTSPAG